MVRTQYTVRDLLSAEARFPFGGGYLDTKFQEKHVYPTFFRALAERFDDPAHLLSSFDPDLIAWLDSKQPGLGVEMLNRLTGKLDFVGEANVALGYGETRGYAPLIDRILAFENQALGTRLTSENILITTGSQQALYLIADWMRGKTNVMGEVAYLGAVPPFKKYSGLLIPLPVDAQGLVVEALEPLLARVSIGSVYAVPFGDNPTAVRISEERMRLLHELSARYGFYVILDRAYECTMEDGLTFSKGSFLLGDDTTLKRTILVNSSSKSAFNGRIGWMQAAPEIIQSLVNERGPLDLHPPMNSQVTLER